MGNWIWLALAVVFLITEAMTVTMTSLWFAAGCLAALVVGLLGGSWGLQLGVALAVSAILLACLRPIVQKHFQSLFLHSHCCYNLHYNLFRLLMFLFHPLLL